MVLMTYCELLTGLNMHIKYMHINIRVWGRKNKLRDCDATGEAALGYLLDTGNLFL